MKIEPVKSGVGAGVSDVDVRSLSDDQFAELDQAWAEYGLLFLRGQTLSPTEQLDFATRFAAADINKFFAAVEGHPAVAQVLKEPHQASNIGGGWHADHTYDVEPARGSVLYSLETPPTGGDTLFANAVAAAAALSEGFRDTLSSLRAVHSNHDVFGTAEIDNDDVGERLGNSAATSSTTHPILAKHPITGQETLFVNPGFTRSIEGWTKEESRPLLKQLYAHITQPQFTTRFSWEPGSIAMWDNRSVWHYAINDYAGHRRLMHRVTIKGTPIESAA